MAATPKLDARQARAIVAAETRYTNAKREREAAKRERDELITRYADRLPLGEWIKAGGHWFRRTSRETGKRFSLSQYLAAGGKITQVMAPFVSQSSYENLDVKQAD